MDKYNIIKEAIIKKQQIHAIYKGKSREMCPHVIGLKNGKEHVLFYQFGGESSSRKIILGSSSNWRCLFVDELEDIQVIDGNWYTADNHSSRQTCVDVVDLEVEI